MERVISRLRVMGVIAPPGKVSHEVLLVADECVGQIDLAGHLPPDKFVVRTYHVGIKGIPRRLRYDNFAGKRTGLRGLVTLTMRCIDIKQKESLVWLLSRGQCSCG